MTPHRYLIDPTPDPPNLKAIREAAQEFAAHQARLMDAEAAEQGITRGELILKRIEEKEAEAHYMATLQAFARGEATFEEVRAADPMAETIRDGAQLMAERYARNVMRERLRDDLDFLLFLVVLFIVGVIVVCIVSVLL